MAECPTPEAVPENPYQIPDGRDLGPERVFEDLRARGLEGQRTEWRQGQGHGQVSIPRERDGRSDGIYCDCPGV